MGGQRGRRDGGTGQEGGEEIRDGGTQEHKTQNQHRDNDTRQSQSHGQSAGDTELKSQNLLLLWGGDESVPDHALFAALQCDVIGHVAALRDIWDTELLCKVVVKELAATH